MDQFEDWTDWCIDTFGTSSSSWDYYIIDDSVGPGIIKKVLVSWWFRNKEDFTLFSLTCIT